MVDKPEIVMFFYVKDFVVADGWIRFKGRKNFAAEEDKNYAINVVGVKTYELGLTEPVSLRVEYFPKEKSEKEGWGGDEAQDREQEI